MKIICTLSYISSHCNDWATFCDKFGWDNYCCVEGGGDIEQTLTLEEAHELGLLD